MDPRTWTWMGATRKMQLTGENPPLIAIRHALKGFWLARQSECL